MSYVRQNPFPRKLNWPFTINRSSPQAYGLVNWWPGSGFGRFLEDLGPGQRHLQLKGTNADSMWSPGVPGSAGSVESGGAGTVTGSNVVAGAACGRGALLFDGSTNFATNPRTDSPTAGFFSACCWLKPTVLTPAKTLVSKDDGGSNRDWDLGTSAGGNLTFLLKNQSGTLGNNTGGNITLLTNVWQHAAWTWDGVTMRMYVNATQDSSTTALAGTTLQSTGAPVELGDFGGSNFFNGQLEDVRIYNRALTRPEIYRIWHPDTRWDLRKPLPSVRRYFMFEPKVNPGIGAFQPVTASQTFDSWMPYADEI